MAKRSTTAKKTDTGAAATSMTLPGFSPVATKAMQDIMSEGARFMTDRMKHDIETQLALMSCKTATDVFQVQSDYVKTATQQCTETAMRLYMVMSASSREIAKGAGTRAARNYDDVPL